MNSKFIRTILPVVVLSVSQTAFAFSYSSSTYEEDPELGSFRTTDLYINTSGGSWVRTSYSTDEGEYAVSANAIVYPSEEGNWASAGATVTEGTFYAFGSFSGASIPDLISIQVIYSVATFESNGVNGGASAYSNLSFSTNLSAPPDPIVCEHTCTQTGSLNFVVSGSGFFVDTTVSSLAGTFADPEESDSIGATAWLNYDIFISDLTAAMNPGSIASLGETLNDDLYLIAHPFDPISSIVTVPLPAAFWFLGSGLIGLIGWARQEES